MKNRKIEVEGGELLLRSAEGHYAVIPVKYRREVLDMLEDGCEDCLNNLISTLPKESDYAADGTVVSDLWREKTGMDWSEAKHRGLTDGSYQQNIELRNRIASGEFDNLKTEQPVISNNSATNIGSEPQQEATDFNSVFKQKRAELGANNVFEYNGKMYRTNLAGEPWNPTQQAQESMQSWQVNDTTTKPAVPKVEAPKPSTDEVKFENWEDVKKRQEKINSMPQKEIVEYANQNSKVYTIVDKKKNKMYVYKDGKQVDELPVVTAMNEGDEQTRTVVRNGKVHWEEGNRQTGAGIYEVSGVNPYNDHYKSITMNFKNEEGIEVPTAIHGSFGARTSQIQRAGGGRMSNGCINMLPKDIARLYKWGFGNGSKMYVLPDKEDENKYEIVNGKLVFKSDNPNVNRTRETLNYKAIGFDFNDNLFRDEQFKWNDFNDEKELETTHKFIDSLKDHKREVMQIAKINGDVYNEIAKVAFGIYGVESGFGDTHSALGNFVRAGLKATGRDGSSPDVVSKYNTYGLKDDSRSVGYTQMRFSYLDDEEREALKKVGITDNSQLLDPEKSALATVLVLGIRYRNQLTPDMKKDIQTYLPKTWNKRDNYSDRVRRASKYITLKQEV